ncbi:hypothetical protein ACFE04_004682 [Oxalis oulophora]
MNYYNSMMLHNIVTSPTRKLTTTILCSSNSNSKKDQEYNVVELPEKTRNSRVLVLGGTGRVGGSTAIALSKLCPDLRIVVGGRNREKGEAMVTKLGRNAEFAQFDFEDVESLEIALRVFFEVLNTYELGGLSHNGYSADVDLVVHAAGPFQQTEKCTVLEAAIKTKTAYVDVCDDTSYAFRAKSLKEKAIAANIPAITTAGIYPGVSNVMAAELVRASREEGKMTDIMGHIPYISYSETDLLRFYYYTAGTGGAGPTILATSFLLLGEEVVAYNKGPMKLMPDFFVHVY